MVGFVQQIPQITNKSYSLTNHYVQCFYGKQRTHYDMEKTVSVKTESDTVKVAVITSQNKILTQTQSEPTDNTNLMLNADEDPSLGTHQNLRRPNNRLNAHLEHIPSQETDKAISFINNNDLGWTADVCKLQANHPEYGAHCQTKEQQLVQLESDIEENTHSKEFGKGPEFAAAFASL